MGDLRVLLMPEQDMQSKNQVLLINHPKYKSKCAFMIGNEHLLELQKIDVSQDSMASWFIDNFVVEDGSVYLATRFDPLFLMIDPLVKSLRISKENPAGKFCIRSEFFYDDQEFSDFAKLGDLNCINLEKICDAQEIRGFDESAYRLNYSKLMDWLNGKVQKLSKFLAAKSASVSEKESFYVSLGIVCEYLDENVEKRLLEFLKVSKQDLESFQSQSSKRKFGLAEDSIPSTPQQQPVAASKKPSSAAASKKSKSLASAASNTNKLSSYFQKK